MSAFGHSPIWVYRQGSRYLCDESGWLLAFTSPGKAIACLGRRSDWRCQIIGPEQLVFLVADLHEIGSPGIRLNSSTAPGGVGRTHSLDEFAQSQLCRRAS
jgi:hypothetical protein